MKYVPVFLKGFLSNSSSVKGKPVFGFMVGVVGFLGTPAPSEKKRKRVEKGEGRGGEIRRRYTEREVCT